MIEGHHKGLPSQGLQDICLMQNHGPLLPANLWIDLLDSNPFWLGKGAFKTLQPLSPAQFIMSVRMLECRYAYRAPHSAVQLDLLQSANIWHV